jgi:protocatechuate 3,4-dioxygenase beta subunit
MPDADATFPTTDPAGQPARAIAGYPRSLDRTPATAPIRRFLSRADGLGPARVIEPAGVSLLDLSRLRPTAPRALGQLVRVTGRVLDEDGRPVSGAVLEVWQANAAGKYIHPNDPSPVSVDPNFAGVGRIVVGPDGGFELLTIKPGAYPVPYEEQGGATDWWRPPHIHVSIFGPAFASRLVTQVYFPGEVLNERDLLLNSVPDPRARERLVARFVPALSTATGGLGFAHDLVLRGRRATPFEEGGHA